MSNKKNYPSVRKRKPHECPTYTSWAHMKYRCDNKNFKQFKDYGGRGILYHPSWAEYSNFLIDMGHRPQGTTLDRIDNSKGYCKDNCRWATKYEQALNKRPYSRSKSTLPGTRKRSSGRWSSQININGKKYHLGTYDTEQEANERFIQERTKRQTEQGVHISEKANAQIKINTF